MANRSLSTPTNQPDTNITDHKKMGVINIMSIASIGMEHLKLVTDDQTLVKPAHHPLLLSVSFIEEE
jgi:hypothetical protein